MMDEAVDDLGEKVEDQEAAELKASVLRHTRSASDVCTEYLRELILSGRMPDEEPIVIDRIARDLGMSKTPIREAIRRLEAEELVTYKPRYGARVRGLKISEFNELVMLRKSIETILIQTALKNADQSAFEASKQHLDSWEKAVGAREMLTRQWQFLKSIYLPSGLVRFMEVTEKNWSIVQRYHVAHWRTSPDIRRKDYEFKREVLERCQALDAAGATQALVESIEWGGELVEVHSEEDV